MLKLINDVLTLLLFSFRFPETLSAVDFEGRTALHYAAVLPDNGHYYNLLQQLGANSKDLDDVRKIFIHDIIYNICCTQDTQRRFVL